MRVAEFSNVRCKKDNSPLPGATAPSGPGSPNYRGFKITFRPLPDHTHTHTQTLTRGRHPCHPAEFELTIVASELPQTHVRRRAHWDRLPNHSSVYISIYASKQEDKCKRFCNFISSVLNFFVYERFISVVHKFLNFFTLKCMGLQPATPECITTEENPFQKRPTA